MFLCVHLSMFPCFVLWSFSTFSLCVFCFLFLSSVILFVSVSIFSLSLYFFFVVVLLLRISTLCFHFSIFLSLCLSRSLSFFPTLCLTLCLTCARVSVCVRVRATLCGNHLLIKQDPGDQLNHHPDDPATLAASNWHRAMRPTPAWPLIPSRSWTGAWIS